MKKRDSRLSSALNPRFDVVAPKRELENAEKQIAKVRKEAQKTYEREKKQLVKRLETLPLSSSARQSIVDPHHRISQAPLSMPPLEDSNTDPHPPVPASRISSGRSSVDYSSGGAFWQALHGANSRSGATDIVGLEDGGQVGSVDRITDALNQLKFIYDCALQIATGSGYRQSGQFSALKDEQEGNGGVGQGTTSGEPQRKSSKSVRAISEGSIYGVETSFQRKLSRPSRAQESFVSGGMTPTGTGTDPGPMMEYNGPSSQAVQLISMARVLAGGRTIDPKGMRNLTAVMEESRLAVKAIKSGVEPDRAQEKLIKKLNDLMDAVKPRGTDLIISPEELLRCSYLRLSKENIEQLENMIREKGFDPGLHCHSDIQDFLDNMEHNPEPRGKGVPLGMAESDTMRNIQPMSIYMTKAGAPIDRTRTSRPDSVPGPSTEEEMAKLKKFRAP